MLAAVALVTITMVTAVVLPKDGQLLPAGLLESRNDILAYLRAAICGAGSAGVLAFWYVDQGVYQRLLHSVFAYGLFVESEDNDLPQIRSSMYLANLDVTNRLGVFYRAQFLLFAGLSLFVNLVGLLEQSAPPGGVWVVVMLHIAVVLAWEVYSCHRWPSLSQTISDFSPGLATKLPVRTKSSSTYAKMIKQIYDCIGFSNFADPTVGFDKSTDPSMPEFLQRIRHQKFSVPTPPNHGGAAVSPNPE